MRNEKDLLPDPRWFIPAVIIFTVVFVFVFYCLSHAESYTDEQAVKAIIGEAENQGSQGMLAVACAIRNRGTLQGVYGFKAPRVIKKLFSNQTKIQAIKAWDKSQYPNECSFIDGGNHWENINAFGKPKWAYSMKETYRYKDHVFYRPERKS